MSVQFDTFTEFLNMGGHGLYVWLCYGLGLLVVVGNLLQPLLKRKALRADLERRMRRERARG